MEICVCGCTYAICVLCKRSKRCEQCRKYSTSQHMCIQGSASMRRITQCMYRSKCTRKTDIQRREEQLAAASRKRSHFVARSRFAARPTRDDGREDLNGGKALPSVGKQPCLVGTPPPRKQQQQQRERAPW